ncbi:MULTISPECIES: hypothetical protein [Flavobacteriaceae]|uniref:hypothetical protein n=1 Tax=Flavobacteriaceae TaxID=49546 RepID=UPI001491306F|nr:MULTISPECIES: hypothetical protein [Allomuricauda]MDC6366489.1 hypothetical protein [Muricauda sp. AC10]
MTDIPIAIIPFHDWRKIQLEGFRTRDAHFIEEFTKQKDRIKVIINRPTTLAEVLAKRKLGLIKGKRILKKGPFSLYEIETNLYLIDYFSRDILGQLSKGYSWFFNKYASQGYQQFIEKVFDFLQITDVCLLNQNIFAAGLVRKVSVKLKVFDAWDNFNKFHVYHKVKDRIKESYKDLSVTSDLWITNSTDNMGDFSNDFAPKKIVLVSNGVDLKRFVDDKDNSKIPDDLKAIKRPIVGFGGKISQLIDVDLLNETMEGSPFVSFVFVGQILDKEVFSKIKKLPNYHYLGDKHYDQYPKYVKNFDVCIVPYVVEKSKKSGANTIKVYEYLATQKKIIGTPSNGIEYLSEYVYIINNANEFIAELRDTKNLRPKIVLDKYSWKRKVNDFLTLIEKG